MVLVILWNSSLNFMFVIYAVGYSITVILHKYSEFYIYNIKDFLKVV